MLSPHTAITLSPTYISLFKMNLFTCSFKHPVLLLALPKGLNIINSLLFHSIDYITMMLLPLIVHYYNLSQLLVSPFDTLLSHQTQL